MKRFMLAAAALLSLPAIAQAQVTIQGDAANTTVTGFTGSNGLMVSGTALPFGPFTLPAVNSTFTTDVLSIGTGEGTVNVFEDTNPRPISVSFSFLNPGDASGSPVTGTTFGYVIPLTTCGIIFGGCGAVNWSDTPTIFNFGNGGGFSLLLQDASFATPGQATVRGTFTYLAAPVPEPATWAMMLVGFGVVGFAMRRSHARRPILAQPA